MDKENKTNLEDKKARKRKERPKPPKIIDFDPLKFGERLNKILKENNIKVQDLAYDIGKHRDTVDNCLNCGKSNYPKEPKLTTIIEISQALNKRGIDENLNDLLSIPDPNKKDSENINRHKRRNTAGRKKQNNNNK